MRAAETSSVSHRWHCDLTRSCNRDRIRSRPGDWSASIVQELSDHAHYIRFCRLHCKPEQQHSVHSSCRDYKHHKHRLAEHISFSSSYKLCASIRVGSSMPSSQWHYSDERWLFLCSLMQLQRNRLEQGRYRVVQAAVLWSLYRQMCVSRDYCWAEGCQRPVP